MSAGNPDQQVYVYAVFSSLKKGESGKISGFLRKSAFGGRSVHPRFVPLSAPWSQIAGADLGGPLPPTTASCMASANHLAHQNRTIAIASDFRVDGAKSPAIPQKEGVLSSEIAAWNRKSLATFHRTLKSQRGIAFSCLGNRAISGVRDGHRNRKSQKSLRFRRAKASHLSCEQYPCVSKQCPADAVWRIWTGSVSRHGLPDTV